MTEYIFPASYKANNLVKLIVLTLIYIAVPVFICIVGGMASMIPYVSSILLLLDAIVIIYCAGGIVVNFLVFFGVLS